MKTYSAKILNVIGRNKELLQTDMNDKKDDLASIISSSSFLVLGGAGFIGQAVTQYLCQKQ